MREGVAELGGGLIWPEDIHDPTLPEQAEYATGQLSTAK